MGIFDNKKQIILNRKRYVNLGFPDWFHEGCKFFCQTSYAGTSDGLLDYISVYGFDFDYSLVCFRDCYNRKKSKSTSQMFQAPNSCNSVLQQYEDQNPFNDRVYFGTTSQVSAWAYITIQESNNTYVSNIFKGSELTENSQNLDFYQVKGPNELTKLNKYIGSVWKNNDIDEQGVYTQLPKALIYPYYFLVRFTDPNDYPYKDLFK